MSKYLLPPALVTLVLGIIGAGCLVFGQAALAPSLGSAAFSQMLHPDQPSSRPSAVAIGQVIGAVAGLIGVLIVGQAHARMFVGSHDLPAGRVVAMIIAVAIAAAAQVLTGAKTPAGGATALVVALGIETASWEGASRLLAGIVAATILGEAARRLLLRMR